jgi:hypothetical protein
MVFAFAIAALVGISGLAGAQVRTHTGSGSLDRWRANVRLLSALRETEATNVASYRVLDAGMEVPIVKAWLTPDRRAVSLELERPLEHRLYQFSYTGLVDDQGEIHSATNVWGEALCLETAFIVPRGEPAFNGRPKMWGTVAGGELNWLYLPSVGGGLAGTEDHLFFLHRPADGSVQVFNSSGLNSFTRTSGALAGIMVRETLDPGSRFVAYASMLVQPSTNNSFASEERWLFYRDTTDGPVRSAGKNLATTQDAAMSLWRSGDYFRCIPSLTEVPPGGSTDSVILPGFSMRSLIGVFVTGDDSTPARLPGATVGWYFEPDLVETTIQRRPDGVQISWPTPPLDSFYLQQSSDLGPTAAWAEVGVPITVLDGGTTLAVQVTQPLVGARFFRLRNVLYRCLAD